MASEIPRVSIGIPVYNGENYLAETLDAIQAQTFEDFEIVISDNASTDGTEAICLAYAARDSRIHYRRQVENLGAAPNYNDVFHRSRGAYFKWSAHDDLIRPTFLEACVSALDANPGHVVAYTLFDVIDSDGAHITLGEGRPALGSSDVAARVGAAMRPYRRGGASDSAIFGLMRRSALDQTRLHESYTGSDRTILVQLAVLGPFFEVPERLFLNRDHPSRSIRIRRRGNDPVHARESWYDTKRAGLIVFPNWRRLSAFSQAILQAPIKHSQKVRCAAVLFRWVVKGNWKPLINDLRLGLAMAVSKERRPTTDDR